MALNTRNRVIHAEDVSIGGVNTVFVNPSDVIRPAIVKAAASIVVLHNHPSGDPTPSPEDRTLTERIGQAATLMGIRLLDHVIVSHSAYYSFSDAGAL